MNDFTSTRWWSEQLSSNLNVLESTEYTLGHCARVWSEDGKWGRSLFIGLGRAESLSLNYALHWWGRSKLVWGQSPRDNLVSSSWIRQFFYRNGRFLQESCQVGFGDLLSCKLLGFRQLWWGTWFTTKKKKIFLWPTWLVTINPKVNRYLWPNFFSWSQNLVSIATNSRLSQQLRSTISWLQLLYINFCDQP